MGGGGGSSLYSPGSEARDQGYRRQEEENLNKNKIRDFSFSYDFHTFIRPCMVLSLHNAYKERLLHSFLGSYL